MGQVAEAQLGLEPSAEAKMAQLSLMPIFLMVAAQTRMEAQHGELMPVVVAEQSADPMPVAVPARSEPAEPRVHRSWAHLEQTP